MTTDDTVRTKIARLEERVEQGNRALRERLEARTSESLRRFDAHAEADEKRFDSLDEKVGELGKEMRAELAALREIVSKNRVAIAAATATIAGIGSLVGTLAGHLLGGH